jgi:hypothetical protein
MADATSDFLCPITHELMTDPVIDPNGNNYERSAIENWLKEQSESPIVSSILRAKNPFFNTLFCRLILILLSMIFVQMMHYVQGLKNIEIINHHQTTL